MAASSMLASSYTFSFDELLDDLCEDLDDFDFCLCEEDDLDEAASF
jgi:hypothetical protein